MHSITIIAPPSIWANPTALLAMKDVRSLLAQAFRRSAVTIGDRKADIQLVLPELPIEELPSHNCRKSLLNDKETQSYEWRSREVAGKQYLVLDASSAQAVSFGLYGLLQERLGYRFYHPRRTLIPHYSKWPISAPLRFGAEPRFERRGFHLHTLHPTELCEQLNDSTAPHALDEVKEYIDWLARNQQNVFQFSLLRDVDRGKWPTHAAEIVRYAHDRGIAVGVHCSLSMLQQKAFQAIHLLRPFPSYRRQIDRTLVWLFQVPWDFVTVDFTMGEHLPDLGKSWPNLKDYLTSQVIERYGAKIFYSTHVIRRTRFDCPSSGEGAAKGDNRAGMLVHSVMCFSVTDESAPVYGNNNQRFVLDRAIKEKKYRETWYWPESSYWVAFDDSVPLLILPYLSARWNDLRTMEQVGVAGHITFSSGWEWGYWLTDWSIARWSWRFRESGHDIRTDSLSTVYDLFPDGNTERMWQDALTLQRHYLIDRRLVCYLSALPPFAELPAPFNSPFQPMPPFTMKWLAYSASDAEIEKTVVRGPVEDLAAFAAKTEQLAAALKREEQLYSLQDQELGLLAKELRRGLEITGLRAHHRALVLKAVMALNHEKKGKQGPKERETLLREAAAVRHQALALVREQETIYRYPVSLLAGRRGSRSAYQFGYLYPVANLHFWQREEEQVRHERFDAIFMNIWDFKRVLGLSSLF